jgi:outer membrane protein OmpA-like peptidoglycan-associated protein
MKKIIILITVFVLSINFSFAQSTENYTINLLDQCNDELSNFGTSYYGENKMIYASPDKKHKIIRDIWNPNQQPFLDLFVGDIGENGEIINSKQLVGEVKTKYHEADVIFTKDLQTVYFTRDNYYKDKRYRDESGMTHLALFKADVVEDGKWINIVAFPYNNSKFSIGHPALSNDEKTLYFISDMPGTIGKTDVFKVSILENNKYSLPKNLGPTINTKEKEMFVYVSQEDILYFSSEGWKGYGQLDVFAYNLNLKGDKPTNLGEPINSYLDDFAFLIDEKTQTGYFSSNRGGGKGDDDIYYFKQKKPIVFKCDQVAKGVVTNKKTGRRISGALVVLFDNNGKEIASKVVSQDAKFSFDIDCSSNYKVEASKDGYSIDTKEFESTANLELALDLNIEKEVIEVVTQQPIVVSTPIQNTSTSINSPYFQANYTNCQYALDNINTIYFDLNKHDIRSDAAAELNRVIVIMQKCPNIKIEAGSHTDSRASDAYNNNLSKRRAQATVNYITYSGVRKNRIYAVGYGETQLLNRCKDGVECDESEHQINRRTKFTIVNY